MRNVLIVWESNLEICVGGLECFWTIKKALFHFALFVPDLRVGKTVGFQGKLMVQTLAFDLENIDQTFGDWGVIGRMRLLCYCLVIAFVSVGKLFGQNGR
jgi:hypothetical protein